MAHWKTGDQSADVARIVTVVKVQDGLIAVVKGGLLDALQAKNLGVKIVVLLRRSHAQRQVMVPLDVLIQAHLESSCRSCGLWQHPNNTGVQRFPSQLDVACTGPTARVVNFPDFLPKPLAICWGNRRLGRGFDRRST
jgi:hypothetical protein